MKKLREKGVLPAVLYGPKIKSLNLEVNLREFEKTYGQAGESSLISLEVKAQEAKEKKYLVLIYGLQKDPLTDKAIHVDFYQPSLKEEVEAAVPIVFGGEAPAVKDLGGTLVRNISEVKVKALPQNLPKEIKVGLECLKTFENSIFIKDLKTAEGVRILRNPEEIVAYVSPAEKVEEELEKPIEEKVEEVEKVEKERKVEEVKEEAKEEKKTEAKPEQ